MGGLPVKTGRERKKRQMKKLLAVILMLIAVLAIVLVGCDSGQGGSIETQKQTENQTERATETPTAAPTDASTEPPHVCSFGDWVTVEDATCTEDGLLERVCECGEKETQSIDASGHTVGDDGYCSMCDLPLHATEGVEYELSLDGTYAIVKGYSGAASRIIIAEEYEGVPVQVIEFEAFKGKELTDIVIPDSVISIGENAFLGCFDITETIDGVTYVKDCVISAEKGLVQLKLREGTRFIADGAFAKCFNLAFVSIPDSVTSIGNSAFWECTRLTSVVIPDSVTSIGYNAFYGCGNLTSVVIPDSVTSIADDAFLNCGGLTSIGVDANNTNYKSIDGNLYSKDGTTLIQYAIGKTATTLAISDNVTSIENRAFAGCTSLTSIVIPDSVTSIADGAFLGCRNLTSVVIPDSVTSIADCAFAGCTSLTSIVIPDSVTSIGYEAFYNCSRLTSITIPDSVTSIGYGAFSGCKSLTTVYYTGSEEQWAEISIDRDNSQLSNATIIYNYKDQ